MKLELIRGISAWTAGSMILIAAAVAAIMRFLG